MANDSDRQVVDLIGTNAANAHASAAPQSWPTTWARGAPAALSTATT